MKAYLVMGSTGKYEDHRTWVVIAYARLSEAEHHAKRAQEEGERLIAEALKKEDYPWSWGKNSFDEKFTCDACSRRTIYYVLRNPIEVVV
jgi:hypothetical protein